MLAANISSMAEKVAVFAVSAVHSLKCTPRKMVKLMLGTKQSTTNHSANVLWAATNTMIAMVVLILLTITS